METNTHLFSEIKKSIEATVQNAESAELFEPPLVAAVSAQSLDFSYLKSHVMKEHLLPEDLLPTAQSVVAFFLPFRRQLTAQNRKTPVSREWAEAYIKANQLIQNICENLHNQLLLQNIKTAWQKATHNFDEELLIAPWSHKSVAYIAGLGKFGVHKMLITPAGASGRFGSIVLDAQLPNHPLVTTSDELCLQYRGKDCLCCVKRCPTGALTIDSFDRSKCYEWLLEVDQQFPDLGLSDVCGKCLLGPCAHKIP